MLAKVSQLASAATSLLHTTVLKFGFCQFQASAPRPQPIYQGFKDMVASQVRCAQSVDCHQGQSSIVRLAEAPTNAIAAKGLGMVFKNGASEFQALQNVDLKIPQSSIQLLMGPSGSGKTTLLSILAGLLSPTEGQVCLLGQDPARMSDTQLSRFRLENIGFVFQDCNLFPALSAVENIELAFKLKGISRRAARKQARDLLEAVGLADKAENLPRNLSGGQKQRIAIARALAGNPALIMADEPTAALDSHSGQMAIELLRRLAKENGTTVLMVTHDPRVVHIADHIAYLEDGALRPQPDTPLQIAG